MSLGSLAGCGFNNDYEKITVVDAPEVISCNESPTMAIRQKKNSSLVVGLDMLAQSEDIDAIEVNGNEIDTYEYIRQIIVTEIPIAVYSKDSKPIEYEEETREDPRLAKLKELLK